MFFAFRMNLLNYLRSDVDVLNLNDQFIVEMVYYKSNPVLDQITEGFSATLTHSAKYSAGVAEAVVSIRPNYQFMLKRCSPKVKIIAFRYNKATLEFSMKPRVNPSSIKKSIYTFSIKALFINYLLYSCLLYNLWDIGLQK